MSEQGTLAERETTHKFGRVANPGDYDRNLDASCFADSRLLRAAGKYIESGNFETGLKIISRGLKARNVLQKIKNIDIPLKKGTFKTAEGEVMILPEGFDQNHPAMKMWELLHRNMSLILQRGEKRNNPEFQRQLLEMDRAYAESLRLGAIHRPSKEKEILWGTAVLIEGSVNRKLALLKERLAFSA